MKKLTIFGISTITFVVILLTITIGIDHLTPIGYDPTKSDIVETMIIIPKGSINPDNNLTFQPNDITIEIGINNKIRWINQDEVPIFINSINGNWTQIQINPGETNFLIFVEPGEYEYFGHPGMNGKIIVHEK